MDQPNCTFYFPDGRLPFRGKYLSQPMHVELDACCIVADDGRVLKNRYGATNPYVVTKP